MRNYSPNDALEPSTFAVVLAEVFHGEPWDEIEPYAARAWSQLPAAERWEAVRESVLQHFEQQSTRVGCLPARE